MNTEERNQVIMDSLNSGMSLSDVQKLLSSEYKENLSYLELRLLASELAIDWEKRDKPKKQEPQPAPAPAAPKEANLPPEATEDDEMADESADDAMEENPDGPRSIVTIDDTPLPQTAMSGSVAFPSGAKAKWFMDRYGRLGLADLEEGSGQPTDEDFQDFQVAMQIAMQERTRKLQELADNGNTQVEISPVVKPGCDFNGTVTFDSGIKGEWMLSQGRLEFEMDDPSQKPTREEQAAFQVILTRKLRCSYKIPSKNVRALERLVFVSR